MPSIGQMIEKIDGLRFTNDLSDWEEGFVEDIRRVARLTGKQVEVIECIHNKHFG